MESPIHAAPLSSPRYRTHHAGELRSDHVGQTLRVAGFVHKKRELGGLVFVELRDASGIVQCLFERSSDGFEQARGLTLESVVSIEGRVLARTAQARNAKLATGEVELSALSLVLLSAAEELPFVVHDEVDVPEELRLRYRFLDLRRKRMHANIELRSRVIARLRQLLGERGFLEIQTPILTASSPEGARDFLVPSRLQRGKFYALPQAPQLFKQLLMMGGFERYFQIAPCFRDEDARADRSPGEFYQLDIELAFVEQEQVFAVIEPVLHTVFTEFGRYPVAPLPFARMTYREALTRYGTDKPDLRNPLAFEDVTHAVPGNAGVRAGEEPQCVRALAVPQAATRSRRWFAELRELVQKHGAELAWSVPGKAPQGHAHAQLQALASTSATACLWLFAAQSSRAAHELRARVGRDLGLIEESSYRFCWVVDFPMYERERTTGAIVFSHNPFSMPQGDEHALAGDPLEVLAYQYDVVCNGIELSSGALRNHRPELLLRAFEIAGVSAAEVGSRFGGLLRALRLGAPPHAGLAPGVDRILMLLSGEPNLREITPFPLTQSAQDLLLGAPSAARPEQLAELGLRLDLE